VHPIGCDGRDRPEVDHVDHRRAAVENVGGLPCWRQDWSMALTPRDRSTNAQPMLPLPASVAASFRSSWRRALPDSRRSRR